MNTDSRPCEAANRVRRCTLLGLVLAGLAACAGCWEEIRYQGQAALGESNASAADSDEAGIAEPPRQEPAETAGLAPAVADGPPPETLPPAAPAARPFETVEPAIETPTEGPTTDDLFGEEEPAGEDAAADEAAAENAASAIPEAFVPADAAAGEGAVPDVAAPTPAERRAAWRAASDWALAVAVAAKGHAPDHYLPYLVDAERAATTIDVTLPPRPVAGDVDDLEAATIALLAGEGGRQLAASIAERLDAQAGAAARLAAQIHLLLLTYAPSTAAAQAAATDISAAGWESQLPIELWQPLVRLIEQGAPFLDVRNEVFALREAATKHFAEQAGY